MAGKREKPEEIVSNLRQVEVLQGQGMTIAESVRQIGVTQQTSIDGASCTVAWAGLSSNGKKSLRKRTCGFGARYLT